VFQTVGLLYMMLYYALYNNSRQVTYLLSAALVVTLSTIGYFMTSESITLAAAAAVIECHEWNNEHRHSSVV